MRECTQGDGSAAQVEQLDLGDNELRQLNGLERFSALLSLDLSDNRIGMWGVVWWCLCSFA